MSDQERTQQDSKKFGTDWATVKQFQAHYGHLIGRTLLYTELIPKGRIKTAVVGKEGTAKGRRIVYLPSVEEYLHGAANVPNPVETSIHG